MISNTSMMKIVLVLVGGLAIYANVMYIRAELVYKEKRGNQRIKDEPDESLKKVKKLAKQSRSEERRVGKECRSRRRQEHKKKKKERQKRDETKTKRERAQRVTT